MEEDWEPFEILETEEGTTLYLHGTEGNSVRVEADKGVKILEAIERGWNVDIHYAFIDGGIDISGIGLERDESGKRIIAGAVWIMYSDINGVASFTGASFNEGTSFVGTKMTLPASFAGVELQENRVWAGLRNEILSPMVSRLTGGRKALEEVTVTDFSRFNTTTVMDGSSNPRLKRYIDDEQWIKSWRQSGKLQGRLFYVWEAMCHCGRSIGLWAGWSAFFALLFAFIYWLFGCDSIAFDVGRLGGQQPNFLGYFYYSVVTFTTLGFGDIVPLTNWARLAVGAEVVCGYVMLGGLISIFANKLVRRS